MREFNLEGGGVCIEKSIPGGGVCIEKSIEGGGVELNNQLLDPDSPTLASQVKLKVSPKGLPFVTKPQRSIHWSHCLKQQVSLHLGLCWPDPGPRSSGKGAPLQKGMLHSEINTQ